MDSVKSFNNIPTPCYILNYDQLRSNIDILKLAINKYWQNTLVGYSFKTNSLRYVCELMKKNDFFAEVVSHDEYMLARELGFDKIIYNGIAKTQETFDDAIERKAIINLDSAREIEWAIQKKVEKIGIRVNFDLEAFCEGESACGALGGRFGFCYENGELLKAINRLNEKGVRISGIHLHCSTKTRSLKVYEAICQIAKQIIEEYSLDLDYIDIGGGFFGGVKGKVDFLDYFKIFAEKLSAYKKTVLIVEPGASLIASAVDYLTTVTDVKDTTYGRYVVSDGSRIHIDPFFNKQGYEYVANTTKETLVKDQTICGFTCIENDRIMQLTNRNELSVGDKILYKKVGAYTMSLSPLFISYYPDIWLHSMKKNELRLIRKKWNCEQYLANQF